MDVPDFDWNHLTKLVSNRATWKALVRNFQTRTRRPDTATTTADTDPPPPSTAPQPPLTAPAKRTRKQSNLTAAQKYRARDAHYALFYPPDKNNSKRKRKCTHHTRKKRCRTPPLTDKQRAAAARAHWDLNHAMPPVLGHHTSNNDNHDHTLPLTPPSFKSMMEYHQDLTVIRNNIKIMSP